MNRSKIYKNRNYAIGIAIGIPIGIPIGLVLGNLALGPAVGIVIGLIFGWVFNYRDKTKNEEDATNSLIKDKIWHYTLIFGIILLVETILLVKVMGS